MENEIITSGNTWIDLVQTLVMAVAVWFARRGK